MEPPSAQNAFVHGLSSLTRRPAWEKREWTTIRLTDNLILSPAKLVKGHRNRYPRSESEFDFTIDPGDFDPDFDSDPDEQAHN